MMLRELAAVPPASLPIRDFADHLRLGTGFADDGSQDPVLETALRSAIGAIEARTSKALYLRRFQWTVAAWSSAGGQAFPIARVLEVESLTVVDRDGGETVWDASSYVLEPDAHRPRLLPVGTALPVIPAGGVAEVVFQAGFGVAWSDVPADLRQAVLMLAAGYFENRGVGGDTETLPFGIHALIAPYRDMRLGGGSR